MDVKARVRSKKAEQSERTRAALVRAATALFARRGYEGTRIDEVAHRARVTKGALYHQFRDKRDLFEAVAEERVTEMIETTRSESGDRVDRLGVSRHAASRYLVGLEILIDRLCEPANRRILLVEGPVVLGPERWHEVWGTRVLELVRSVFRGALPPGEIEPALIEPLSNMLYGALQEVARAIGRADDPDAARRQFGAAARWVLEGLLRRP